MLFDAKKVGIESETKCVSSLKADLSANMCLDIDLLPDTAP
jgi:hypothetical protein